MPAPRSAKLIADRYEVGALLRQGGITSFYKGRDVVAGRQVQVKLLRPTLSDDPVARARFERDANILQRLSHPHIIRVYEVFRGPERDPAVITEWLHGPSLEQLIADDGPMRPAQAAAVGRLLAEVLDYIEGQKVVRLDLKPSTVVMADRGPVIVDLGIAIQLYEARTAITVTGQFVGTPSSSRQNCSMAVTRTRRPTSFHSASCCITASRERFPGRAWPTGRPS